MTQPKGFGPRPTTRGFTVAVLGTPAPGAHEVAIDCPHGAFTVTALPDGLFLSDAQLPHISPGCLTWLAENRDAIGRQVYGKKARPP
jgi:hypothetical protein